MSAGGIWKGKTRYPRERCEPEDEGEGTPSKPKAETGPERWVRWHRMLEFGEVASRADLARREGVSRAAVTMGLAKLACAR